jgi:hypothetical protein
MANVPEFLTKLNYSNDALGDMVENGSVDSEFNQFNVVKLESDLETNDIVENVNTSLISVPLYSIPYDKDRIQSAFDLTFTDFGEDTGVSATSAVFGSLSSLTTASSDGDVVEAVQNEIANLTNTSASQANEISTLLDLLDQLEGENLTFVQEAGENYNRMRELITGLRIQLGEGNTTSDFSNVFPFLPLSNTEVTVEPPDPFPFTLVNQVELPDTGSNNN